MPENPTIKDFIHVEIEAGLCHVIYSDDIQIEGDSIKLTIDVFENIFNPCNGFDFIWVTSLGKLPAGNYELEFYVRTDTGDGYGDPELQAVIPFNVQNVVGVPVNNWVALMLLIIGISWLSMHSRFLMR